MGCNHEKNVRVYGNNNVLADMLQVGSCDISQKKRLDLPEDWTLDKPADIGLLHCNWKKGEV